MFHEIRLNAGYIKTGKLTDEKVTVVDMKPLVLAFIGWNEEWTRRCFQQFAHDNATQIYHSDLERGVLRFRDGSIVRRISPSWVGSLDGYRFDQIILAEDSRLWLRDWQYAAMRELNYRCCCSEVPEEFRYIHYNIDDPEPTIHASVRTDAGPIPLEVAVYGRFKV